MRSSVIRMRRIVVLPEPDGPISASFSPGITCIDSPSSTLKAPKLLVMPSILMIGSAIWVHFPGSMGRTMRKQSNHVN